MPYTHALVATTPDDPSYEIRPSHWNAEHEIARTAAEIAAGVTPVNYGYEPGNVLRYGGAFDDATDDSAAWAAAISVVKQMGGDVVRGKPGASSYVGAQIVVDFGSTAGDVDATERGIVLDLQQGRIRTDADIELIRVGAAATSTSAYRGCGIINGTLRGGGAGDTSARALVVRNHSYGIFKNLRLENWGARPLRIVAYGRGVQYNSFQDVEICFNHAGAWEIDSGSTAGGYVNDNTFINLRAYENPQTGGTITHARIFGSVGEINGNAFYRTSLECNDNAHTLLKIEYGEESRFYGLRLDGNTTTTVIDIASGVKGTLIFGWEAAGTIVDASNASMLFADFGASDHPTIRLGSLAGANSSYDVELQQPSSNLELHIAYNGTDGNGLVRFPVETPVYFGYNAGAAPITIDGESQRLDMRTLPGVNIGSGPHIRFDGEYSASGDEGSCLIKQTANGVDFTFSTSGDMLHSSGAMSVADGITAPSAVSGRAIIYVDTADGDLKVRFGDGTIKTIVVDT